MRLRVADPHNCVESCDEAAYAPQSLPMPGHRIYPLMGDWGVRACRQERWRNIHTESDDCLLFAENLRRHCKR